MAQENEKSLIIKRAQNAILARDYVLAERLFKGLLHEVPGNIEYLTALGDIYVSKGDDKTALKFFQKIIELEPGNFKALNSAGAIYRRMGQYFESIEIFQRALDTEVNDTQCFYNIGFTYKDMGRYDRAITCFENVLRKNPNDALAFNHLGVIYAAQKNYSKAVLLYKRGLQIDSRHPVLQMNLARSCEALENYDDAVKAYEIAIISKPGWKEPLTYYISLLIRLRKFREAVINIQKAIKLFPDDISLKQELGKLLMCRYDFEGANKILEDAEIQSTSDVSTLLLLSKCLEKMEKFDEAIYISEKADSAKPGDSKIQRRLAHVLLSNGEIKSAEEKIKPLYESNKKDVRVLDLLGQYFILKNDSHGATEIYKQINAISGKYTRYMLEAADRFLALGKINNAEKFCTEYLKREKDDVDALITLSKIYDAKGFEDEAAECLKSVLQIDPTNLYAKERVVQLLDGIEIVNERAASDIADGESDFSQIENEPLADEYFTETADEENSETDESDLFDDSLFDFDSIEDGLSSPDDHDVIDFDVLDEEVKKEEEEIENSAPIVNFMSDELPLDGQKTESEYAPDSDLFSDEDIKGVVEKKQKPVVLREIPAEEEPVNMGFPEAPMYMPNNADVPAQQPQQMATPMQQPQQIVPQQPQAPYNNVPQFIAVPDSMLQAMQNGNSGAANAGIAEARKIAEEAKKLAEEAKTVAEAVSKKSAADSEEIAKMAAQETAAAIEQIHSILEENLDPLHDRITDLENEIVNGIDFRDDTDSTENEDTGSLSDLGTNEDEYEINEDFIDSSHDEDSPESLEATDEDVIDISDDLSFAEVLPDDDSNNDNSISQRLQKSLEFLPEIIEMLQERKALTQYEKLLILFKNIKKMISYLPPDSLQEFMTSKTRIQLDFLICKLSGKPGLISMGEVLNKSIEKGDVASAVEEEVASGKTDVAENEWYSDSAGKGDIDLAEAEKVISHLGILATSLEDKDLAQALVENADEVLQKLI